MMTFPAGLSKYLLLAGIFCALLGYSCKDPKNVTFREVRDFGVDPKNGIQFKVVLYNPNDFSFRISRTQAEVILNGRSLGIARQQHPTTLPASAEATVSCTMKLNAGDALRLLPSGIEALLGGKPMTVKTIGSSAVSKFLFSKTIRFDTEQQVDGKLLKSLF